MSNNYRRRYYEERPEEEPSLSSYEEKTEPKTRKGIISGAAKVNIRKSPTMGDNVVTVLNEGDEVTIVGEVPNYYKVMTPDHYKDVYVSMKYCREV